MMKRLKSILTFSLIAAALLLPASLRASVPAFMTNAATQNDKDKVALYEKFKTNSTGDVKAQKTAYETGKEYLKKYPNDTDAKATEVKTFVELFEKEEMRPSDVLVKVYKDKKYAEAFQLGKQILVDNPDNIKVLTALGYAGMLNAATGNNEFSTDAIAYAKKAIQLIESGKNPPDWKPLSSTRDETLGWLNYSIGLMSLRTIPGEAMTYLMKAAMYEGKPKKDPTLYYYIALLREQDAQKLRAEHEKATPNTPEATAASAKLNETIDMIIDAYARVISYLEADPQAQQRYQQQKAGWMEKLTTLYKFRHKDSDAGLKEYIAGIQAKPMPGQPEQTLVPTTMTP
ncbi:MAG: hypothetical protein H7Y30_14095 [Pyrinomonadaceae bacterium]|nr:hypothetical protein [Pyrinomonadaceae bacterium]